VAKKKTVKKARPKRALTTLRLEPGRFYKARDGSTWCCFVVDPEAVVHAQAYCVNVASHQVEYFYIDGRYDGAGKRGMTLISEMDPSTSKDTIWAAWNRSTE